MPSTTQQRSVQLGIQLQALASRVGVTIPEKESTTASATKLVEGSTKIFELEEADAVNSLLVLINVLSKIPLSEQSNVVTKFITALIASKLGSSHKSLILGRFYNILPKSSKSRFSVYEAFVKVSGQSDDSIQNVLASLPSLDENVVEWGISQQEKRGLYLLLSETLSSKPSVSYQYLVKYLSTFQESPQEAGTPSVKKLAADAIKRAIQLRDLFNFDDLLPLVTIKLLAPSKWLEVLDIMNTKDVKAYLAFLKATPNFLKENGLHEDEALRKIRVLTLADLGTKHIRNSVPLSDICEALQVAEDEAEYWVIDGMRAGLIDAKMNQLDKTVSITRATYRSFGNDEWKLLQAKLENWNKNIKECVEVIENASK